MDLLLKKFAQVAAGGEGIVAVVTPDKKNRLHVVAICRGEFDAEVVDSVAALAAE